MARVRDDVADAEHALERLFRLTMNRKVHTKQTAAIGADVTRAGYAVLRCIQEAGEPSLGEIARECSMDPAATSRQVKAL
ncbi:MAG TPA: MarR family transcriptional regulator, partial [Acidimicrobiia bacterium]|nr:MarR family transcriptional regulator [Acidimicrobiia bacterium]